MLEKTVAFLAGPDLPFAPSSLAYKRAYMFVFAVPITVITFGSYIIENLLLELYPLASIESAMLLLLLGAYLDFRRNHRVQRAMLLLIFTVSAVTISGLYFEGIEPYAILFWTAALPLFVFLLLGHRTGLRWSLVNIGGIAAVIVVSAYSRAPLFPVGLLLQVLFGYLVVSAIAYYFERQRATLEQRLSATLRERESLLREIHHRVKNNMQVIIGLLWLQSESTPNPACSQVLRTNIDRLSAIAALHERLYEQKNIQRIDMHEYLEAIVSHLRSLASHTITLTCEPLHLEMHHALQVGLITNEAVTNALQHAFTDTQQGEVRIRFAREGEQCILQIADNGRGMKAADVKESLGSLLIRDFADALPHAALQIETAPSVTLTLTFSCTNAPLRDPHR